MNLKGVGNVTLALLQCHNFSLSCRLWKIELKRNNKAMYKLKVASESAKCALSNNQTTSVHVESLYEGIDFQCSLSRYAYHMLRLDCCFTLAHG